MIFFEDNIKKNEYVIKSKEINFAVIGLNK